MFARLRREIRRRRVIRELKQLLAEFPDPPADAIAEVPDIAARAFAYRNRLANFIRHLENDDYPSATIDGEILLLGSGVEEAFKKLENK